MDGTGKRRALVVGEQCDLSTVEVGRWESWSDGRVGDENEVGVSKRRTLQKARSVIAWTNQHGIKSLLEIQVATDGFPLGSELRMMDAQRHIKMANWIWLLGTSPLKHSVSVKAT